MPTPWQWQDPDEPWQLADGSTYDPKTRKGTPARNDDKGCGSLLGAALALGLVGLTLTACGADQAFRVAFCGMPAVAVVVLGLAVAWYFRRGW